MTKRFVLKQGDIFEVPIDEKRQFIQYLMNDTYTFSANVIRAFDYEASNVGEMRLEELVKKKVKFYTHTIIKGGVKLCNWKKVGNIPLEKEFTPPMFRATNDIYSEVKKSNNWVIWPAGDKESKRLGRITGEYRGLNYGSVMHPIDIVEWLKTGGHGFMRPD